MTWRFALGDQNAGLQRPSNGELRKYASEVLWIGLQRIDL